MSLVFICGAVTSTVALGDSASFKIFGQVQHPLWVTLDTLQKLPVTTETVTYGAAGSIVSHTFTGTSLWTLLQIAGLQIPNEKNGILRLIVIITGTDGYEAVFGAGELSPSFGQDQIIVAYGVDGQLFTPSQFAQVQIIAPGDKLGGRFVDEIAKIEVRNVDLPVRPWN